MSLTGSPSILRTSQRCLRGDWRVYSTTRPWCVISQAWTWLMHPYWMRPPRLQRRCSSATGERPRAGDIGQSHHRCVGGASPAPLSLSLSHTHTHMSSPWPQRSWKFRRGPLTSSARGSEATRGLQEIRVATREDSRVLCFPSRRHAHAIPGILEE